MRTDSATRGGAPAALLLSLVLWAGDVGAFPAFKIFLENSGVYRVTFEQLADVGLPAGGAPSAGLGLSAAGQAVPIWVEDGGDGHFGPGDWIELIGEHLPGAASYLNEYTRHNVYTLRLDHPQPPRMSAAAAPRPDAGTGVHAARRRQHLERDLVILRLPAAGAENPEELWYWAKLVHGQRQPFEIDLDLRDLATGGAVELRLGFRGWSQPASKRAPEVADHNVRVSIGDSLVASAEWNGTDPYQLTVPNLDAGRLVPGINRLKLEIPKRQDGPEGRVLVDVVMLNWIEVSYSRAPIVGEWQARFELEDPASAKAIHLRGRADRPLLLYGAGGSRAELTGGERSAEQADFRVLPAAGESAFFATHPEQLWSPEIVVLDEPSNLAATGNRADYLIIAHRELLAAIEPLATMHRARGLEVAVIDVENVYDEFGHGIAHPRALRSFLEHAYRSWARPAPRFVLLVGDASWDGKNALAVDENYADWTFRPWEKARFIKNRSTAYAEGANLNHRNLIPTFNHATSQGHSASDNRFVAFGENYLPKMAIGRLPVVEPSDVSRIVEKTIRYVTQPEVGPWRRNALLITNESRSFQSQSDNVANQLVTAGFAPIKIYPASTEASNAHHSAHLIESFNEGQLFVHFLGHGGRYIWRTGPPDLDKNHDLFTLEHLDRLEPTGRLPLVISLTCYSAPFDHPSADSIGEKLLRLDGRGAVAVFAASWRNSPSSRWGRELFKELTQDGVTIGEAIMRAKASIKNRLFVETYNLLGDPAAPVALPSGDITLRAWLEDRALNVRAVVDLPEFAGEAVIDLVGEAGEILSTQAFELGDRQLSARLEASPAQLAALRAVRAYAWNSPRGVDAVGAVKLGPLITPAATPTGAASAGTEK